MGSNVIRHASELGRLERIERSPDSRLRGIAYRYCGYSHAVSAQVVAQDNKVTRKAPRSVARGPGPGKNPPT